MSEKTPGSQRRDDLDVVADYEQDLRRAERKVAGEIDPGARAVVVAVLVLAAMVSLVLTHASGASGLDVLTNSSAAKSAEIRLPSRIFVYLLLIFGVGFSGLALLTRRWVLAWIALCGSAVASVIGMLAVWTRNTPGPYETQGPGGVGAGLIIGWVVAIVLTFHWSRVVWARSAYHLALENERRKKAAETESFRRSLQRAALEINAEQSAERSGTAKTGNDGGDGKSSPDASDSGDGSGSAGPEH